MPPEEGGSTGEIEGKRKEGKEEEGRKEGGREGGGKEEEREGGKE